MMHAAGGGENNGSSRGEGQAYESLAGNFEIGLAVGRDLYDSTFSRERRGDVQVAVRVKGQALRPPQTFIERVTVPLGSIW